MYDFRMLKYDLQTLKKHFGTDKNVAKRLGVSERHVRNIRAGRSVSSSLAKLVSLLAKMMEQ